LNISLTPELEKFVKNRVASGYYNNASEVMREALRLLLQRDVAGRYYDDWLRAQIEIGVQQADRGELEDHDMDSIINAVSSETRT